MKPPIFTRGWRTCAVIVAAVSSTAQIPPISQQVRSGLDRTLGAKGTYESESAYKFSFPRTDVSLPVGAQRLSPEQSPASDVEAGATRPAA